MRRALPAACLTALAAGLLAAGCSGGDKSSEPGPPPPVPTKLADGTTPAPMPDAVRRFRGKKVIQAKEVPGLGGQLSCPPARELADRVTVISSFISTDGLGVGYGVNGANQLYSCDAVFVDGHWKPCASKLLELSALSPQEVTKEAEASVCSDPPPERGFVWAVVPSQNTAWALVDHRSYWDGYFVFNKPVLRITSIEGLDDSSQASIVFVDQRGRVVSDQHLENGKVVSGQASSD